MTRSLIKSRRRCLRPFVARSAYAVEALETRRLLSVVTWIASTGGDFNTPGNWNTGKVPGPMDDAVISAPGIIVTVAPGDNISVNSVTTATPIDFTGGNMTFAAGFAINNTTVTLGAASAPSVLTFTGSQSLAGQGGNIVFSPTGTTPSQIVATDVAGAAATLTISNGLTIDGGGGAILASSADASIMTSATVTADSVGAPLLLSAANGGTGTLVNAGAWSATTGELDLAGSWTNKGTLTLSSTGTLGLGGNFSLGSLGNFTPGGGTINVTGTFSNAGGVLALSPAATGNWNLLGGTIAGGTVTSSGGATLILPPIGSVPGGGVLNGVTLGAGTPLTIPAGSVGTIIGGLTLTNTTLSIGANANLEFDGTQTLGGTGSLVFSSGGPGLISVTVTGMPVTLTIAAGITIDGTDGTISAADASLTIVNHGTISADVAGGTMTIDVTGSALINAGVLGAINGGTLNITGNLIDHAGASTQVGVGFASGSLNVSQNAALAGPLQIMPKSGFAPLQGQTFNIVNFGSSSGSFSMVTGLTSGSVVLSPNSGATGLSLTVTSGGLAADLAFSGTPVVTQMGNTVFITATEVNSVVAAGPFSVEAVLSADTIFGNADDIVLATVSQSGLAAGATQALQISPTIPANTAAGNYYVFIQLDSTNAITESNKANNTFVTPTPLVSFIPPSPPQVGGLDPRFGVNGLASHNVGLSSTADLLAQGDGQSVIVGTSGTFPNEQFGVARYTASGSVDTGFGSNGDTQTALVGDAHAAAGFLLPDGDILVAGTLTTITGGIATGSQFALVEFTSSGALDTSFGGGTGMVLTSFSTTAGALSNDVAHAMVVTSSGEIFVGGSSDGGGHGLDFALAAYNSDGTPATGFGGSGKVLLDFAGGDDAINALALQPKGSVLAAGYTTDPGTGVQSVALARFLPSGAFDTHFGNKGKVVTNVRGVDDAATSVAIVPKTNKIVAGGFSATGLASAGTLSADFLLLKYTTAGKLDHSFGQGGIAITSFSQPTAVSRVIVEPNGFIAASGKTTASLGSIDPARLELAIAQYTAKGQPDTSFNGSGKAIINLGTGAITQSLARFGNEPRQPAMLPAAIAPFDSSSTLMQEFNQLVSSAQGVVAVTLGGELADVGNNNANTVEAVIIQTGVDLTAAAASGLPQSIIGGAKGTFALQIKEAGNLSAGGTVTIELFASTASQVMSGDQPFQPVTQRISLKQNQSKVFHLKFVYPSSLPSASYNIFAMLAGGALGDVNPSNNTAALGAVNIAAPNRDLTGSLPAAPAFVDGKPSTVHFTISDSGNLPIVGRASVEFFASADGTTNGATSLAILPLSINLKPGALHAVTVKFTLTATLPARQYFLLALLDPSNALGDTGKSNNLLVSGNTFTVGG